MQNKNVCSKLGGCSGWPPLSRKRAFCESRRRLCFAEARPEPQWGNCLVRTEVDARKPVQWLEPGDVLFVARGARNYAVCLREVPKPTVCFPNVFLLHIKSPALLPEFLACRSTAHRPSAIWPAIRGAAEGKIRQEVIEENLLDVVIGLPEKLFHIVQVTRVGITRGRLMR
jgi:hypothetical protein